MFVETKTKPGQITTYRDWLYICKHGNIAQNARGGATVLLRPKVKLGRANPPSLNNPLNDCLHFTIPYQQDLIHVFLVYIHPHSNIEQNILTKACLYKYSILIGDFNLNRNKTTQLNKFLDNSDFIKKQTPPTFLMPGNPDSTPDLLLHTANLANVINNVNLTNELGSDHLAITFDLDLQQTQPLTPSTNTQKLNLNKTDVQKVKQYVHDYIQSNAETCSLENIQKQLTIAIEKFSPRTKNSFYQHTLPKFILRLIKRKRELYRLYSLTQDNELKIKLNELNRNVKTLIDQYKQDKWLEACQEIEQDAGKTYWQKIKKLSQYKKNHNIGTIKENGTELYTDKEKADAFAQHFRIFYPS